MKLKLPLALLTALAACMASAEETTEITYQHTQIPEGTIPVYEKATGTETEDYTVHIQGDYGHSWFVNAKELTWDQSHDYVAGRPINVGSALTASTVNIVKPEGATDDTVVSTGANLFIGCSGWGVSSSETYKPMTGIVNVEKGATLIVGKDSGGDTSTSQLNIGAGASYSQYGHEGILNVNGGEVLAGLINVANGNGDVKGTLNISEGGTAVAEYRGGNTGVLTLGYYADASGVVNVSGGSSIEAEYYTMVGYGRDGAADGTLNVSGDSTAQLGSFLFAGRENGSSGTITVDDSNLTAGTTYLGYNGAGGSGSLAVSNDGSATLGNTYLGYGSGTSGKIDVDTGASASVSTLYLGRNEGASGEVTVSGANQEGAASNLSVAGLAVVGYDGQGTVEISDGGTMEAQGQLVIGYMQTSSGTVTVDGADSKLTVKDSTFLGNSGANTGKLELSNGASAELMNVWADGTSVVSVTGGSSLTVGDDTVEGGTRTLSIGENAQLIVDGTPLVAEDGTATQTSIVVHGNLVNYGKVTADLSQGGSIEADMLGNGEGGVMQVTLGNGGSVAVDEVINEGNMTVTVGSGSSYSADTVTNSGNMDITLAAGSAMKVKTYTNVMNAEGTTSSTITAEANTTCEIDKLDLAGGSMALDGEGSFNLGGDSGLSSEFYVTGVTETTNVDVTALNGMGTGNVNFTINEQSVFTLNFMPESLADLESGMEKSFTLTLIKGNSIFSVDDDTLLALLGNAVYSFERAQVMALAVETDVTPAALSYQVTDASFEMAGNDLIWKGTVKAIPEPTTATLSLLALAALAARRRRK